ncbi:unnamed protein product, partial [Closterium sp. NIES-54]
SNRQLLLSNARTCIRSTHGPTTTRTRTTPRVSTPRVSTPRTLTPNLSTPSLSTPRTLTPSVTSPSNTRVHSYRQQRRRRRSRHKTRRSLQAWRAARGRRIVSGRVTPLSKARGVKRDLQRLNQGVWVYLRHT